MNNQKNPIHREKIEELYRDKKQKKINK